MAGRGFEVKLSEHFTLAEFIDSDTAARHAIDNSLPATLLPMAARTCEMLERIRAHLMQLAGKPIPLIVTSGYRCQALNAAIGSSPASDHVLAMAADFKAPLFGSAFQVAKALAPHVEGLEIGQLIHEFGAWVHVSTRRPTKQLNRIITIGRSGVDVGIKEC
jgi:zinc D-Ala-D-Ala carboxypeptidase